MGEAYEASAAARPARAAVPDAGLRDRATPRSAPTCATASASCVRDGRRAGGRHARGDLGLLRLRHAAQRHRRARPRRARPGSDLPPPARRSCWGSLVLVVLVAASSRCRCSASSATTTTSTIRRAEAVAARDAVTAATGAFAAPSSSRSCGWTRRPTARRRQAQIARVARALRDPRRGVGGRLPSPAATAGWSPATAARPTCWRRSGTTGGARATRSRSGPRERAGRDARRRRVRRAAGRRPGLGGHRARRADRLPDPLPADAARLPQRGRRRCCRWPSAARRSCSRSSRSGSSTRSTRCRSSR